MTKSANPLKPTPSLLCKLGSLIVHTQELASPKGHLFDKRAMESLLDDQEVKDWMAQMDAMAMLPRKR